jgi:hypothetical protein
MLSSLYKGFYRPASSNDASVVVSTTSPSRSHELNAILRVVIGLFAFGLYFVSGWFTVDLLRQFAHTDTELYRYFFLGSAFEFCKCLFLSFGALFIARRLRGGLPLFLLGCVLMGFSIIASMGSIGVTSDQIEEMALHQSTDYQARQLTIDSLRASIASTRHTQEAQLSANQITPAAKTSQRIEDMEERLSILVNDLQNAKPSVAASSSFFNGLHSLFLMIGHDWKAEYILHSAPLYSPTLFPSFSEFFESCLKNMVFIKSLNINSLTIFCA